MEPSETFRQLLSRFDEAVRADAAQNNDDSGTSYDQARQAVYDYVARLEARAAVVRTSLRRRVLRRLGIRR